MEKNLNLRDYQLLGCRRAYEHLVADLEAAFEDGFAVYLWSSGGQFVLAGHQDGDYPWSDSHCRYKSVKDALNKRNGRRLIFV